VKLGWRRKERMEEAEKEGEDGGMVEEREDMEEELREREEER